MNQLESLTSAHSINLEPNDAHRLASLCGQFDENLRLIEQRLGIEIRSRDNFFAAYGEFSACKNALDILFNLYQQTAHFLNYLLKKFISTSDNLREKTYDPKR